MKEQVINEILHILDETINSNIECMKDSYTVAEIAKEVLLSFNVEELKDR